MADELADPPNGQNRCCERQEPATEQASASPEEASAWGNFLALRPRRSGNRRNKHVPESTKDGTDHYRKDDLVRVNPIDRRHPDGGCKSDGWSRSNEKNYHHERDYVIETRSNMFPPVRDFRSVESRIASDYAPNVWRMSLACRCCSGVIFGTAPLPQSTCNRDLYFVVSPDAASIAFAAFFSSSSTSSKSTIVR